MKPDTDFPRTGEAQSPEYEAEREIFENRYSRLLNHVRPFFAAPPFEEGRERENLYAEALVFLRKFSLIGAKIHRSPGIPHR